MMQVTGAWAVSPATSETSSSSPADAMASTLGDFHVGTPSFLEARLKWRKVQPLTVLELRAFRLQQPLAVRPEPSYFGCFSWGESSSVPKQYGGLAL